MAGQVTKSKDEHKLVNNTALKLLAICDRSKGDLRDRLLKKGYSAEVVEEVLNRLESKGYLNDSSFALRFAADAVRRKNLGPDAVRSRLLKKGIKGELMEETIRNVFQDNDEADIARKALSKVYRKNISQQKEIKRLSDYLRRRGFSYDIIRKTIGEIKEEDNDI